MNELITKDIKLICSWGHNIIYIEELKLLYLVLEFKRVKEKLDIYHNEIIGKDITSYLNNNRVYDNFSFKTKIESLPKESIEFSKHYRYIYFKSN